MRRTVLAAVLLVLSAQADAEVLYQQPPDPNGGFYHSSWWDPDGSNYDEYVWDRFSLALDADIDTVEWRGTYDPAYGGATPVVNFTIAIYASIAGGSQPDFSRPPLVEYETGDNAGETFAGTFGGLNMYDYRFALPVAFHALAGVRYWVEFEGWQHGFPGWSVARAASGDGFHFRCQHLTAGAEDQPPPGCWFTAPSGDVAFKLLTASATGIEQQPLPAAFALVGVSPNPTRSDRVQVSFALSNAEPAELSLFDVSGRHQLSRRVGALGAGLHVVDLADRAPIGPGIYFVRLSRGGSSQIVKVVVIR